MTTENSEPYLNAAVICEKGLQEKDETLSVIRMIDRFNVTVSALGSPENLPPIPLNLTVLISLKSGKARGRSTVKLRIESPSGLKLPDQLLPVLFEGEDRGVNLVMNVNLVKVLNVPEATGFDDATTTELRTNGRSISRNSTSVQSPLENSAQLSLI